MRKTISTQGLKARVGEAFERNRRELFSVIDAVHEQNRDVPPEQIEAAIDKAIGEVRSERRDRG